MRAVWACGPGPIRVRDVVELLNTDRVEELGYTTVQKVMTILREKGALELVGRSKRAHLYRPRVSRVDAARGLLRDLGERLFGGGQSAPAFIELIEAAAPSEEELQELRRWIDEQLSDEGSDAEAGEGAP